MKGAEEWEEEVAEPSAAPVYRLEDLLLRPELLEPPPVVIPRLAWRGRLTALGSAPKMGKSTLVGQAVAAFVQGEPFLDEPLAVGRVLWLALDEPIGDTVRRLVQHGAQGGVWLMQERPDPETLEGILTEEQIQLLVIDTVTEWAAGLVEDHNASGQWQPLYQQLRAVLQKTDAGGVLLDHTPKGNAEVLAGSLQKMAGVDLVLTMTTSPESPNVRTIRGRGRVPCTDFTVVYDGERSTLRTGELSLDTRIFHQIAQRPGIGLAALRERMGVRGEAVDRAVTALQRRGMVEDRGHRGARAFHILPLGGNGAVTASRTSPDNGGQPLSDEEIERLSIQGEL